MRIGISLENFEEIYNETYKRTLSYIVCKCANIDDVNDLLQDTYVELYKALKRRKYIEVDNYQNYIIGIANKRVKKFYGLFYKLKATSVWDSKNEYHLDIPADIDLEANVIDKINAKKVWNYIKQKNLQTVKVFYLYYYSELKISQIANELEISESNVKNILYRTIKDIKKNVKIEGDEDV